MTLFEIYSLGCKPYAEQSDELDEIDHGVSTGSFTLTPPPAANGSLARLIVGCLARDIVNRKTIEEVVNNQIDLINTL